MPVTPEELEAIVREAMQVAHMKVEDESSGCGEKYFVLIVSKVAQSFHYNTLAAVTLTVIALAI
jgi:stress-induced morphogen